MKEKVFVEGVGYVSASITELYANSAESIPDTLVNRK